MEERESKEAGRVKWFNAEKGYGFIERKNGQADLFVHYKAIEAQGYRTLNEGDEVEFTATQGRKGPAAENVVVVRPANSNH